jgi:aflatoxin B1 aldehyde reductase
MEQANLNTTARAIEPELIPACRRYGLDIVIYNPLAGGFFSGKYKSADIPSEGRYSDASGALGAQYRKRYFRDVNFEALSIVEPVAAKHNLSLVEIALRWLAHHSALDIQNGKDGIIVGVSSLEQLKGNLSALEKGPLPEDVINALDEAWRICKLDASPYWYFDLVYSYDTTKVLFGEE